MSASLPTNTGAVARRQDSASKVWRAECDGCSWHSQDVTTAQFAQKMADVHNRSHHSRTRLKSQPQSAVTQNAATKRKTTAAVTPCSICGSTAVKFKHSRGRKVALTWWLWAMNKKPYCAKCGALRMA